ncbi:MAG: hypothetical protein N3E49_00630 [Bacteroidia bacterium]|nr:hypothetical protein [Bacteroidia bacterium]
MSSLWVSSANWVTREPPPWWLRWSLRSIVFLQILLVSWDALKLMEPYGIRRVQADCAAYLAAARSLLQGKLLKTPSIFEPLPHGWMHEWPLGYPGAIALATSISGLDPFYSSRWLNVILLFLTYALLLYFSPKEAEWLFLFIYPPNYTWNVAYALSENLFIPLLIALVGTFQKYYEQGRVKWLLWIAILSWGIFLTRYAGIAVGAALGLWGLWHLFQKRWSSVFLWNALFGLQLIVAGSYFYWNALHHPTGETGLTIRDMPMPPDLLWQIWELVPFIRFVGLVGLLVLAVRVWRGAVPFSEVEKNRNAFLILLFFTQAALYFWSMAQDRIGIVDMRHFVMIGLPLLWYWGYLLYWSLPPRLLLGIAGLFLAWQTRNTYRHYRWAYERSYVPYSYTEEVRQAYDTLPPNSCVIAGSLAYPIRGARTDLCLSQKEAYIPILLRDCKCFYIDCGLMEERTKLGLAGGIIWIFARYCDKPCLGPICLRKIGCISSDQKNWEGSR